MCLPKRCLVVPPPVPVSATRLGNKDSVAVLIKMRAEETTQGENLEKTLAQID